MSMNTLHMSAPALTEQQIQQVLKSLQLPTCNSASQTGAGWSRHALPDNFTIGRNDLLALAKQHQCDLAVLGPQHTADQFKLLAMDMDSTLITIECIDEIADYAGKKKEVSEITEAAMRGEIKDFSESLNRRVALLKGVPASSLQAVLNERLRLSPGAEALIAFAKQQGWKTLLVSGGFTFFTDAMKTRLGLDYTRSNTLEIVDGLLTGRVLGTIVDADVKRETVLAVCQELGCTADQAIAMGDGANDLKMMGVAGASVAFRAKPAVQAQTDFCINVGGLDTVCQWMTA
ncbi:phosphoserine phosphatase SerB [Limnobacter humi]